MLRLMIVYCRGHELEMPVEDLGCYVGRITCLECVGDGDAEKFWPDAKALTGSSRCIDCKGTGRMLVGL